MRTQESRWTIGLRDHGVWPVMVFIGLIYLVLGIVVAIPLISAIGVILMVVGLTLTLVGRSRRRIGRRAQYW